jgi:hypothetical protein
MCQTLQEFDDSFGDVRKGNCLCSNRFLNYLPAVENVFLELILFGKAGSIWERQREAQQAVSLHTMLIYMIVWSIISPGKKNINRSCEQ